MPQHSCGLPEAVGGSRPEAVSGCSECSRGHSSSLVGWLPWSGVILDRQSRMFRQFA